MRTGITCAFVVLALLVSASNAQEDQPFHTSYFADETTISLSVTVAATSLDPEYNFDVQVALTERGPEGQIRFIDMRVLGQPSHGWRLCRPAPTDGRGASHLARVCKPDVLPVLQLGKVILRRFGVIDVEAIKMVGDSRRLSFWHFRVDVRRDLAVTKLGCQAFCPIHDDRGRHGTPAR